MADNTEIDNGNTPDEAPAPAAPPRRHPGHRNTDVRDTVAEMAARAQEISQEAGSKVAMAMKDVINAAAGLAGFAVESVRDVLQYMVRRGQMTQEEADRVLRDAEDAAAKHRPAVPAASALPARSAEPKALDVPAPTQVAVEPKKAVTDKPAPEKKVVAPSKPAAKAAPAKPAAGKRVTKSIAKSAGKAASKAVPTKKASALPVRAKKSSSVASKGKSGSSKKK